MSYAEGVMIGMQIRRMMQEANLEQQRLGLQQQSEARLEQQSQSELDLRKQALDINKQQMEMGKIVPTPYGIYRIDPTNIKNSGLLVDYSKLAGGEAADTSSLFSKGGPFEWADEPTKAYINTQMGLVSKNPNPVERAQQTSALFKDIQDKHAQAGQGAIERTIVESRIGKMPQGDANDPTVAAKQAAWSQAAEGIVTKMRTDPGVARMLALVSARPVVAMGAEGTPTFMPAGQAMKSGATPTTPITQASLLKPYEDFQDSKTRLNLMDQLSKQAGKDKTGAADQVLLALHLGMSTGTIKGMRTGEDILQMHAQARSFLDSIGVAFEKFAGGKTLSQNQRNDFLALARDRAAQDYRKYKETADYAGAQPKPSGIDFIDQSQGNSGGGVTITTGSGKKITIE